MTNTTWQIKLSLNYVGANALFLIKSGVSLKLKVCQ